MNRLFTDDENKRMNSGNPEEFNKVFSEVTKNFRTVAKFGLAATIVWALVFLLIAAGAIWAGMEILFRTGIIH